MDQETRFKKIEDELTALREEFYRNNFIGYQEVNKAVKFTQEFQAPHYDTLPPTCNQSAIAESGGKLYVCSAANTWTVVGTQT